MAYDPQKFIGSAGPDREKSAALPAYVHQDFPGHRFKDGASKLVRNLKEHAAAEADGWTKTPPLPEGSEPAAEKSSPKKK